MTDVRTDGQRKRVFIRTYGCQMNVYDPDRMADVLRPLGYAMADTPEQADLVVLNTCHIREHASRRSIPSSAACAIPSASAAPKAAISPSPSRAASPRPRARRSCRQPAVDIVVGPQAYHRLPELLAEAERKAAIRRAGKRLPGAGVLDTDFPAESKFDHLPRRRACAGSAFLSIQEGCDKFCTFCVVPYTRGAEYSRPASAVLSEARQLVAAGAIEITLLGQNVNAYHGEALKLNWLDVVAGAPDPCPGRDRWRGAHPLHDLPSARHGRRSDRRPRRGAAAHAVPAPAGAVGLRPHPRGDEPPARTRSLPRPGRSLRHARADLALSSDFIVGFRERATPTSTTPCGWSTRWASPRPSPSSTAAGPARRARRCPTRCPRR